MNYALEVEYQLWGAKLREYLVGFSGLETNEAREYAIKVIEETLGHLPEDGTHGLSDDALMAKTQMLHGMACMVKIMTLLEDDRQKARSWRRWPMSILARWRRR